MENLLLNKKKFGDLMLLEITNEKWKKISKQVSAFFR
jgi:hypothetical protein